GEDKSGKRQSDRQGGQARRGSFAAGRLDGGVDRQRNGARLPRDVGDEGDDGTELTEASGESRHDTGQDSGKRQRQIEAHQPVERAGPERLGGFRKTGILSFKREPDRAHLKGKGEDGRSERSACP